MQIRPYIYAIYIHFRYFGLLSLFYICLFAMQEANLVPVFSNRSFVYNYFARNIHFLYLEYPNCTRNKALSPFCRSIHLMTICAKTTSPKIG